MKRLRDNFDLRAKQPLDKREVCQNYSEIDRPYDGLITYQLSDGKRYEYKSGTWNPFLNGVDASIQKVQSGLDSVSYNVKDYGAIADGTSHPLSSIYSTLAQAQAVYPLATSLTQEIDACAIQKAINDKDNLYFPAGTYMIDVQINIPQSRFMYWKGAGDRKTIFNIADGIVGFNYLRDKTMSGIELTIKDCQFKENGTAKTSTGIKFYGVEDSGLRYHDNSLKMYDCKFYWLKRGLDLKYCGKCHFVGIYSQYNSTPFFLNRDASFLNFQRCMCLDNDYFIYADDSLADGVSNGITIVDCQSVLSLHYDIRIGGWQAVYIYGCGFDLGVDNSACAVWLGFCMDFAINSSWIASNKASAPSRIGIQLYSTHSGVINGCSICNNSIGVRVDGSSSFSTMVSITDNKFDGNTLNDVVLLTATGMRITGNKHHSVITKSGSNGEIYGNTAGTNYNVIKDNIMKSASYTISAGANSIISDNVFGMTP